jgi:hypothetical protein
MECLAKKQLNTFDGCLVNFHHVHHFQILGLGCGRGVVGRDDSLH